MKLNILIHEQDTESAWGSHVSLFLNRDLAEASMRKCWEDALKSWEFDLDKEMYDDHCWEYNHDNAAVLDGTDIERWRIEEQDLAVGSGLRDLRADYAVKCSAKTGQGLDELKDILSKLLSENQIYIEELFSYREGGKLQRIREYGHLLSEEYRDDGIYVKARVPAEIFVSVMPE